MKKIMFNIIIVGCIIILFNSQIISSTSIYEKGINNNTNNNLFDIIPSTELNNKIIKSLEILNETLLKSFMKELLAFGPRKTGSYGCEKAAEYLSNQLKKMGLETRYQLWDAWSNNLIPRYYKSKNIEGTHQGIGETKDEILIFNAHYDSVKLSPGANDDGSGVVAVLAAAYVLKNFKFNRTIKFVLFSGEENGLLGSRIYVDKLYEKNKDIFIEFNADMIGYASTVEGGKKVAIYPSIDSKWMLNDIIKINNYYNINLINSNDDYVFEPGRKMMGSDFHYFLEYGYETMVFFEDERYPYFHTPEDTYEQINFSYLLNVTKLIVASLAYLADVECDYPHVKIGSPRRGEFYFEDQSLKNFKYDRTWVFDDILINAEVKQGSAPIEKVEFFYDGHKMYEDNDIPYQWRLDLRSIRKHKIEIIAYDIEGKTAKDEISFFFFNPILRDK